MPRAILAALCLVLAACSSGNDAAAPTSADATRIRGHVFWLADDLMEGRAAGTRGYDLAAGYVASQFASLGLQPGGDDGRWMQAVRLRRGERIRDGAEAVLMRDGVQRALAFEDEFLPGTSFEREAWSVEAPIVFVGQAVVAPELGQDDLAGLDLHGKIAVMLSGAPARFSPDERAFYASSREKLRLLDERGAVAVVYLGDPMRESRSPWARGAANWRRPALRLLDAEGELVERRAGIVGTASLSAAAAEALFDGSEYTVAEIWEQLRTDSLHGFDLPGTLRLGGRSKHDEVSSQNVVGIVPGSDPALSAQHVVYTAHLDHLGVGAPVGGDAIYNGALDNALGVALLVETARLAATGPRSSRSRVFVALTAEEHGLLGAEHFAANPGLSGPVIANINMDMPVILSELVDVIPIGIEHSSLESVVRREAGALGIRLTPDPFPEEVVFVRSDQFAFVRRGIPAVYLDGGLTAADGSARGKTELEGFLRQHYHQPSDDLELPIHYPSAARLADLNHRIGLAVANDAEPPRWKEGDFFAERFADRRPEAP
ncbi:MAG: M28 family peptidase [Xanthomonadales bacterium]|nr:M28 family peptidase [Xanthomonadales bacterium]